MLKNPLKQTKDHINQTKTDKDIAKIVKIDWKKYSITAGTGLFTASENGWEIYWSLFKFPNHLHRETIV